MCFAAAASPSSSMSSSSTCLGFECSSQAMVRIFLVEKWATSLSGEAGGVGATVLGNAWAMSGVQSSSSVAVVDPTPKTDLRFFAWTVAEALQRLCSASASTGESICSVRSSICSSQRSIMVSSSSRTASAPFLFVKTRPLGAT
eukprot:scaffold58910_cov65-Phaeocystis_antarctica.AAC.1